MVIKIKLHAIVLFVIILIIVPIIFINSGMIQLQANQQKRISCDSMTSLQICITGDLMCHSVQYEYARVSADSFDFNPTFSFVKAIFQKADFVIGNFETIISAEKNQYSGYPNFNSPAAYIEAISNAGFSVLTTANNHCLDQREAGILRNIAAICKNNIQYTGTAKSVKDHDSIRVFNKNGITFALLAYSYGTNDNPIPKGKKYLVNLIDSIKIRADIQKIRNRVDFVIVCFHFGSEYKREPNKYQKNIVRVAVESGADIIIGTHPHVIQPLQYFKTNNLKHDSGLVAFSLGNFISDQRWQYSDAGVILKIKLTKNITSGQPQNVSSTFIPTWVFKGNDKGKNVFYILPEEDSLENKYSFLLKSDRDRMLQSFIETKEILNSRIIDIY